MVMIFIGLFFGLIGGGLGILFLCTGLITHDLLSVFVVGTFSILFSVIAVWFILTGIKEIRHKRFVLEKGEIIKGIIKNYIYDESTIIN